MKPKSKITLTAVLILFAALIPAMAQFTYNAIDLGTLGGPTSTANAVDPAGQVGGFSLAADGSGHAFLYTDGKMNDLGTLGGAGMIDPTTGNPNGALGSNARGEVVGFSATDDGAIHALLFTNGQMIDLNAITDLSAGGFKVLTVAKAINDSSLIVGDGIMTTGDRHAFLLVPVGAAGAQEAPPILPTEGGQWSYANDQWVWTASDGGWGYSGGGWQWNGPGKPPRHHPHTPPPPPPPPPFHKPPFLAPIYGKTPVISHLPPPPPPPPFHKPPFLTPIYGKTPVISHLPPPAPPPPPAFNKTPILTPVTSKLPPPAPPPPPAFNKTPILTPVTSKLTPPAPTQPPVSNGTPPPWWHVTPPAPSPAPSVASSPVSSSGGNKPPPMGGTPPPSALPSPTPAPSPSATPRHHRSPTKTGTPAPSPSATPRHQRPPTKTASPTPSPKPTPREQHHHNPH